MTKTNESELRALRDFLAKRAQPTQLLLGNGVSHTQVAWLALIEAELALKSLVRERHVAYLRVLRDDLRRRKAQRELILGLHSFLRLWLGHDSPELKALGVKRAAGRPKGKKPPLERQLAAQLQARETRRERGTMGRRQRLAIRSTVQPVVEVRDAEGKPLALPTAKKSRRR